MFVFVFIRAHNPLIEKLPKQVEFWSNALPKIFLSSFLDLHLITKYAAFVKIKPQELTENKTLDGLST